jgi:hypothetical protein
MPPSDRKGLGALMVVPEPREPVGGVARVQVNDHQARRLAVHSDVVVGELRPPVVHLPAVVGVHLPPVHPLRWDLAVRQQREDPVPQRAEFQRAVLLRHGEYRQVLMKKK